MSEYNFAALLVGDARAGKTTLAKRLMREFLGERPTGIVLAHDPVGQFSRARFSSGEAALEAIARAQAERSPMSRVLSIGGESKGVTRLAMKLGEDAGNTQYRAIRPVLVVYDEASMLSSGRTHIDKEEEQALATRRHRGVGAITCAQQASQLAAPYWNFSTECRLFWQTAENVARVEKMFGLERGTLNRRAGGLRPFHHLRIERGARRSR